MARRRTVAELLIDVDARTRKATRNVDLLARRLRSLQTIGFTTAVGILASSGTAAIAIATIGTAAATAALGLSTLAGVGFGALASAAIKLQGQTEAVQRAWADMTSDMQSRFMTMTASMQPVILDFIQHLRGSVETLQPTLTKIFEGISSTLQKMVDRLFTPRRIQFFQKALEESFENLQPLTERLAGLFGGFVDQMIRMMRDLSKAMGDNSDGIVNGWRAIIQTLLPSIRRLLVSLINLSDDAFAPMIHLFSSVIDGFSGLAESMAGTGFISGLLTGLSNFIGSFFKVVESLVAQLGPGLGAVFTELGLILEGLEPALAGFGRVFETITSGLAGFLSETEGIREKLGRAIGGVLGVAWEGLTDFFRTVGPSLLNFFNALLDALLPMLPQLEEFAENWKDGINPAIAEALDNAAAWIRENPKFVQNLFKIVATALAVSKALRAIGGAFKFLGPTLKVAKGGPLTAIAAGIAAIAAAVAIFLQNNPQAMEKWNQLFSDGTNIMGEFEKDFRRGWDAIRSTWDEFWSTHGPGISTRWEELWGSLSSAFEAFTTAVSTLWNFFSDAFEGRLGGMADNITEIWMGLWPHISSFLEGILDGITEIITGASLAWEGIFQLFTAFLEADFSSMKEAVIKIVTGWKNVLTGIFRSLAGAVGLILAGFVGSVKTQFTLMKDTAVNLAREMFNRVRDRFILGAVSLGLKAISVKEAILNKFRDLWEQGKQIGRDLLQGLWSGIVEKWSWLTGKIRTFAGSVVRAVKGVFGISSPSREFMGIGRNLVAGLDIGISSQARKAIESAREMARAAMRATPVSAPSTVSTSSTVNRTTTFSPTFNISTNNTDDAVRSAINRLRTMDAMVF